MAQIVHQRRLGKLRLTGSWAASRLGIGPQWSGPPATGNQLASGGVFQTASYVTGTNPLTFSIDASSPTSLTTLNQGGVNLNTSTGALSAPGAVTATAYQIRMRATDPSSLFDISPVFTLQVVQVAAFVWNQTSFQAKVDPTITVGPLVGVPIFDFYENQQSFIDIGALVSGNPASIQINRPPDEEFGLDGITFDPVTKRLVQDAGRVGLGACAKFQFSATDGVRDVPEEIIPYEATKPWIGLHSGPQWLGRVDAKPNGASSEGNGIVVVQSMLTNAGQMSFENIGGDWYDINMVKQGTAPWAFFPIPNTTTGVKTADITTLAKAWERGDFPNLGVILIGAPGALSNLARSTVNPITLTITWTDGSAQTVLNVAADCELNNTFYEVQTYGTGPNPNRIQVSAGANGPRGFLFFDFTGLPRSKRIATATLSATVSVIFTTGNLNIFAVRWQAQDVLNPPDSGLAINYPNDVGIENDPAVIQVVRWQTNGGNAYGNTARDLILNDIRYKGFRQGPSTVDYGTAVDARIAIVTTTDPIEPSYAPPSAGLNALRLALGPSYGGGAAGIFFHWCPFAIFLDLTNPLAQNNDGDLQELYVSYLSRFSSRWEVEPIGGHATGIQSVYNRPLQGIDSRTGRAFGSPLNISNSGGVGASQIYQTNSCALEDLEGSSRTYSSTGPPPPPPIMPATTPMCAPPYNYRNMNLYAYSPVQPGSGSSLTVTQQGLYWDKHAYGAMRKEKWYQIELHFKANTFTGTTPNLDGIHESWVNGRLAHRRTNWATVRAPGEGIVSVGLEIFGPSIQGGGGASYGDVVHHISNMIFSKQRIGLRYFS